MWVKQAVVVNVRNKSVNGVQKISMGDNLILKISLFNLKENSHESIRVSGTTYVCINKRCTVGQK